jgi:hypothetical protein
VGGLGWVKAHVDNPLLLPTVGTLGLGLMLCVAAGVQLLGLLPRVRAWVRAMPTALAKGFLFVTAVGIVVGMVEKQLGACLQFSFWPTVVVYAVSVGVACGWAAWVGRQTGGLLALKVASLPVGMGVAWLGYALFLPGASSANGCGRLGVLGLQWSTLADRIPAWPQAQAAWLGMGTLDWAVLAAIGVGMGLVQLVETLTALDSVQSTHEAPHLWPRYIAASALANLLCAPLGLACSAWSGSRSTAAAHSFGTGRYAVLFHALALLLIASVASDLPLLAVAVALTMVAVQMIDPDTEVKVWTPGYIPTGAPANAHAVWLFWGVVGVGFATGTALYGLLAGAVVAWGMVQVAQMKRIGA